jgi:hypothetical protein
MSRSKTAVTESRKQVIISRLRCLAPNHTQCWVAFMVQPEAHVGIRQVCIDRVHFIAVET